MVLVDAEACMSPIASGIELLGKPDIPAMMALAEATKPGPFGPRTIELGRYIGVRRDDRLVAMAGERMRLTGFTEISAVCVDPAYRGQGLAASMICGLAAPVLDRSGLPFVHAFCSDRAAIAPAH